MYVIKRMCIKFTPIGILNYEIDALTFRTATMEYMGRKATKFMATTEKTISSIKNKDRHNNIEK